MKGTLTSIDDKGKQTEHGEFELEESPVRGEVPERVITELVNAKGTARNLAKAFGDSIKTQAEKYGIKPGALRKYVTARHADKIEEVDAELTDLAKLIG